ncbi:MAG: L-rhamnose mutarotase [Bacteroidales bacterium]|nr:L-rhamnose mutarotase [Bacteroidales bacterium]MDD7277743.1 L-rhamnose mutarotase [Bacteroidales bacterium]MDY6074469.1 L-rhamnose mutarotase [Bacteroidales bacterium]
MKTTGYNTKHYGFPTKHYCRTLELRDNPELIKEYRRRHQQGNVWQEIIDGIKQVGILEMEIFLLGTRLVMIVEAPAELDLDAAMERLSTLPRQAEWERYMSELQDAAADATSDEKWQIMERIFYLYE